MLMFASVYYIGIYVNEHLEHTLYGDTNGDNRIDKLYTTDPIIR